MRRTALTLSLAALLASASARAQLSPDTEQKIVDSANKILHDTGVPSASVAVALHGKLVFTGAFGLASIMPEKPAEPKMAYPIGSISKQFTAQAVLLLQQEGKLSIDDKVGKYFPELTRANEVSLRNLMTMTSGYEDFAPQDYIIPAWYKPIKPIDNIHEWAGKPLDFAPGTDWQYSNTNYVLLGLIVEKVSGEPLYKFIRTRVLDPLHLEGVFNTYTEREKLQVTGYVSNAMQAPRVLPLEATGWYFGDGDLSMPASTLVTWDLGIINQSLLSPASYKEFETPYTLASGKSAGYGLGVFIGSKNGRRQLEHSGEVGGYVAENVVFPDDGAAIVVLTNEVASSAASQIAAAIAPLLFPAAPATASDTDTFAPQLKSILAGMALGRIDHKFFTSNCNSYFNAETLADFQATLSPLGAITSVTRTRTNQRGGMTFGLYRVSFAGGTSLLVNTYLMPDGKIEQFLIVGKG